MTDVYLAEVDIFGYTLRAVALDAEAASRSLYNECRRFISVEPGAGFAPSVKSFDDFVDYYGAQAEKLVPNGKVEWR